MMDFYDVARRAQDGDFSFDIKLMSSFSGNIASLLPLGTGNDGSCTPSTGTFDGGNNSISGITLSKIGSFANQNAALFCGLQNATIKNLVIDDGCSFSGENASALAINVYGNTLFENVINNAQVTGEVAASGFVSSIADLHHVNVTFKNCSNKGRVTVSASNKWFSGGFVAVVHNNTALALNFVHCENRATIQQDFIAQESFVGGFIARVSENTKIELVFNSSSNFGLIYQRIQTSAEGFFGGLVGDLFMNEDIHFVSRSFSNIGELNVASLGRIIIGGVIGRVASNTGITVDLMNCSNSAPIIAETQGGDAARSPFFNVGGMIGTVQYCDKLVLSICRCKQSDLIKMNLSEMHTSVVGCVGGFVGSIIAEKEHVVSIKSSESHGKISVYSIQSNSFVGGFVGSIQNSNQTTVAFDGCSNNAQINLQNEHDQSSVSGFVGKVTATPSSLVSLTIMNSANNMLVSGVNVTACGFFSVHLDSMNNVNATVLNSITKGKIVGKTAYGISNTVTQANNVVSMGSVESEAARSFWEAAMSVNSLFGLKDVCSNCVDVTLFWWNATEHRYVMNGSQSTEYLDDVLTTEAIKMGYGIAWAPDLSFRDSFDVTITGVLNLSISVKPGTRFGAVVELSQYFDYDHFVVMKYGDETVIYNSASVITGDMQIVVKKISRVVIDIEPVDSEDVNSSSVIKTISEIVGIDPDSIILDIVVNEEGKVIRIDVIVSDSAAAISIAETVNGIDKGSNCVSGVLCRSKRAYVSGDALSFSSVSRHSLFCILLISLLVCLSGSLRA